MTGGEGISRRGVLKAAAAAATVNLGACRLFENPPSLGPVAGRLPAAIADVHCHVFNASDLPVTGFLEHVVFEHYEEQVTFPAVSGADMPSFLQGLVKFLARLMAKGAPTAAAELKELEALSVAEGVFADEIAGDPSEVEWLRHVLLELSEEAAASPVARGSEGHESRLLLEAIRAELPPAAVSSLDQAQPFGTEAEALYASGGDIGTNVRWALLLTRSRARIISRFKRVYDAGPKGKVRLFTPALIDFSWWLDDHPASSLAEQVLVMDRLQQLSRETPIHGMAPFDPARQIVDEDRRKDETVFDLVRRAVTDHGFAGVKLYPPMGFRPTRNVGEGPGDVLTFPARAGADFPARLDQALSRLYDWCEANQVPIMAHGAASQPAGRDYAARADPKWWGIVLREHPSLHLNIAHFGDFHSSGGGVETSWEWSIGRLIREGHANLFADLSYVDEVLTDPSPRSHAFRETLGLWIRTFDPKVERLMYGSDWIMLGREKNHERAATAMIELLDKLEFDQGMVNRFFYENALRFLGLDVDGPALKRLSNYRRRYGLPEDILPVDTAERKS